MSIRAGILLAGLIIVFAMSGDIFLRNRNRGQDLRALPMARCPQPQGPGPGYYAVACFRLREGAGFAVVESDGEYFLVEYRKDIDI